jgi:hypothetical protein
VADRAIAVTLSAIPESERRPESEVWRDFDAAAPGILGLLLNGLCCLPATAMSCNWRARL